MPLVAHNKLPTFSRLHERGHIVLTLERAQHQDIRELHIGLLNMMPDAVLTATERQFVSLVGDSDQIAQFYIEKALQADARGEALPGFPEKDLESLVDNTWGDTDKAIVNNWLGLVYQFTSPDRKTQFMSGIDPHDPSQLRTQ